MGRSEQVRDWSGIDQGQVRDRLFVYVAQGHD